MKRVLVVLVAALVLPATAQAKEITSLALCGPDECQDIDASGYGHSAPFGGETVGPPAGHFYRLDIGVDGGADGFSAYYEPVSGLLATPDRPGTFLWLRPSAKLAPDLKAAAKLLEPFPAPRVIGAQVGARQVTGDASTYSALLRLDGPPVVPKTSEDAVVIRLRPSAPNPWTEAMLLYYPRDRVLFRSPGAYLRLPDAMAADVEAARPLGGSDGGAGPIVPWVPIGVGLAGAVVLLLLALRRVLRPAPAPAAAP